MKFDFKGFKTVAFGLGVAILPGALQYLGGVDVVSTFGLSPGAGVVVGAVVMALRAVTSSPIFKPSV